MDKIFKQIDYLLEIHDNIFSALEDHITLLFTFLDQYSLIQQKNPFEHFLNTNSNEILNTGVLLLCFGSTICPSMINLIFLIFGLIYFYSQLL